MPGSSPNWAIGPPGRRFRMAKPMIETITSRTRLCDRRLSRNPRIVPSLRDRFSGWRRPGRDSPGGDDPSACPVPSRRVPGGCARVRIHGETGQFFLAPDHVHVLEQRQEGQVVTNELLDAIVDLAPRFLIESTGTLLQERVHLGIGVLPSV